MRKPSPTVHSHESRITDQTLFHLTFTLNGSSVKVDIPPGRPLSDLLRYDLGLTGTKVGCDEGRCGACTVLVNGKAVRSCVFPARRVQDGTVLTIEGLAAPDGALHPLQEAFIRHGAVQCGFCTPGLLLAAKALLDRKPHPTDQEIRRALRKNLCRCTGYNSIVAAIQEVSTGPRTPPQSPPTRGGGNEVATAPLTPPQPPPVRGGGNEVATAPLTPPQSPPVRGGGKGGPHTWVGRPLPRPDAVAKVTGTARYADDYAFPGMLHGATLRAGLPHARILGIDAGRARALPGVRAVLTHADLPGARNHGLFLQDWPVLCYDKVRYVGDAVAIVAADTPEVARQALELIRVSYDPLPVVANAITAREPDAPLVHEDWPTGNLFKRIQVRRGDTAAGFGEADLVVERLYHTPAVDHLFLEPECAVGRPTPDGRIEVYVGSQIPYADRRQIAAALDRAEDQVRVVGTLIGGAFGGKEDIMGQIHAALLAQATGRPVKILYSRQESMLAHPKRHATTIRVRLGARRDGRLTAFEAELVGDTGAYASLGEKVMTRATTHASGPYDVPHVKADCYAMYTNNPPAGAFRGFGVTQSCFAIESAMDELAHRLQIDPLELRRINALRAGATTCTGQVLHESVGLLECLEWVERQVACSDPGLLETGGPNRKRAWGLALAYKNTGLGGGALDRAEVEIEIYSDGHAEVRTSATELGQGLPGVLAAITAEELGIPFEQVDVLLSDTDLTPDGGPTTASRQTYVSGNATLRAARHLREMLTTVVSERLDVPPDALTFRDGMVQAGDRRISVGQAVGWTRAEGRETRLRLGFQAPETHPLGEGGEMHVGFGFAAQAALVEVNIENGAVRVMKVIAAHDVGRAINPLALQGQVEGGIVMGLGQALSEAFVLENGVPVTLGLARYPIPTALDAPEILSYIVEQPLSSGPYGAKGVGELSSIPIIPAITNAIHNAVGVRVTRLPVNPRMLADAVRVGLDHI
jgi:CO/xanthine dehydrogenase Mo-binding subunit/aerobic-type carbon monoxide dehydrogenase small subunit (CoxS/CutS family)